MEVYPSWLGRFFKTFSLSGRGGSQVKFWFDTWCGDQPLRDSFPDFFRLARVTIASVVDHLQMLGSSHHWDVIFSKQAQDWELEILFAFMKLLYSYPIRRGSLDEMCWRPSSWKVFTVRSYYSCLLQPSQSFFPWKSVWKSKVPTGVAFFYLDCGLGEDSHSWQPQKKKGNHYRLVLHVQGSWRVC
jgi:hypothetical protein